jgi:hypothetical protein
MTRCPYELKEKPYWGVYWIWWWGAESPNDGYAMAFLNFEDMKRYSAKHGYENRWMLGYYSDYDKIENN